MNDGAPGEGPLNGGSEDWRDVLLGTVLLTAGAGICYVMPNYLASVGAALHASATTLGILSAGETAGMAIASLTFSFAADRVRLAPMIALAAIATCIGNLLIGLMPNAPALIALRFLTGLVGEGPLYAAAFVILSRVQRPERGIAIALTSVAVVATITLSTGIAKLWPWATGGELTLYTVAAASLLAILPRGRPVDSSAPLPLEMEAGVEVDPSANGTRWVLLLSIMLWFAAPGIFLAFAETAAITRGMSAATVEAALSLAWMLGLVGTLAPIFGDERWLSKTAMAGATLGLCASAALFQVASGPISLTLAITGVVLFWNITGVVQPAIAVAQDSSTSMAAAIPAAELIGLALGPLLGGLLIDAIGPSAILLLCCLFALTGGGLTIHAQRRHAQA